MHCTTRPYACQLLKAGLPLPGPSVQEGMSDDRELCC
jgi:hypothetical protein